MSVRAVRRIASDKTDDEVEAYLLAPPQIGCSMILLLPRPDRSLGEVVTTPVVRIFTGDDGGAWVQTGNSVYFVEPPADAADAAA